MGFFRGGFPAALFLRIVVFLGMLLFLRIALFLGIVLLPRTTLLLRMLPVPRRGLLGLPGLDPRNRLRQQPLELPEQLLPVILLATSTRTHDKVQNINALQHRNQRHGADLAHARHPPPGALRVAHDPRAKRHDAQKTRAQDRDLGALHIRVGDREVVPVDAHKHERGEEVVPAALDGVGAKHDKQAVLQDDEREQQRAAVPLGEQDGKRDAVKVEAEEHAERAHEVDGAHDIVGAKRVGNGRHGALHQRRPQQPEEGHPDDPGRKEHDADRHAIVQAAPHHAPVHEGRRQIPAVLAVPAARPRAEDVEVNDVE